jgi:hypothetical protein
MEYPTLTIDLIDSDALSLLRDMEHRNLIRVNPPEQTAGALRLPPEGGVLAPGSAKTPHSPTRIGFLKGLITVPADFDTLGQETITALFDGNP